MASAQVVTEYAVQFTLTAREALWLKQMSQNSADKDELFLDKQARHNIFDALPTFDELIKNQ